MTRSAGGRGDPASDEALIAAMAVGDEQAGVAFVRRYQRRVYGLALAIVADPGLAEDVAQEALLRIWRHAAVFDPRRGTVAGWVLTVTRHLAIDAIRVRRGVAVPPDDLVWLGLLSSEPQPDEAALSADAASRARSALQQLPMEQRRAVVLATMYGRTASQVAEVEAVPLGTAKSRIRLGMAKLRSTRLIEEAG